MAKRKVFKKRARPKWFFLILIVIFVVGFMFLLTQFTKIQEISSLSNNNLSPTPDYSHFYDYADFQQYKLTSKPNLSLTENWQVYKNSDFGFEVKYPLNWRVTYNDYVFPQRALVSFISDNPYRDGAYFSIANPTKSSKNVAEWYQYINRLVTPAPQKLETETINGLMLEKKFSVGQTCGTHYYLYRNGYIYEINLTTFCDEKAKELNDQDLINILNTFKFNN